MDFNYKLPVYELLIGDDEDVGVNRISLVDHPAIEKKWQYFTKQDEKQTILKFKTSSAEKKIVSGAIMVANLPIYRRDLSKGEYYVLFSPETIEKIAQRYFKKGFTSEANIQHEGSVEGVYMLESFIIDSKRGMNTPKGFEPLPDGSWFGSMKIENQEIWNNFVKTGELTGFSVEGTFIEAHLGDADDNVIKELIKIFG